MNKVLSLFIGPSTNVQRVVDFFGIRALFIVPFCDIHDMRGRSYRSIQHAIHRAANDSRV